MTYIDVDLESVKYSLQQHLNTPIKELKYSKYKVFIDESSQEKGKTAGLISLLVPTIHYPEIVREFNSLRKEIKNYMYKHNYPNLFSNFHSLKGKTAKEVHRIRNGGLPEFHAADMWSLRGVYWHNNQNHHTQHRRWIIKAFKILKKYECIYFSRISEPERWNFTPETTANQYF